MKKQFSDKAQLEPCALQIKIQNHLQLQKRLDLHNCHLLLKTRRNRFKKRQRKQKKPIRQMQKFCLTNYLSVWHIFLKIMNYNQPQNLRNIKPPKSRTHSNQMNQRTHSNQTNQRTEASQTNQRAHSNQTNLMIYSVGAKNSETW